MLDSGSPAEEGAAKRLAARLGERAAVGVSISGSPATPSGNVVVSEADSGPESFQLRVDAAGARLAGDPAGLRYGAEALAQLTAPDGRVPAVHLQDAPALRRRGFLLDISRGKVPRPETVRWLVEVLARLRYNELFLYTEHTFQFEKHPEIGAGSGGYSAAEIRELDAFARGCGVELVPCLQTFGHFRRILEKAPYRRLAESDRLWSVSPAAPGTYPLLRDLLGEYLPNFVSGWAHLNCDEPVDLGKGLSSGRAGREGPAAVFAGHVNRVAGIACELGKRPMIWADVIADHPEALDLLDSSITLADWWYEPDHDFDRVRRFRDAGRDFLTVAGTSSWTSLFPRFDTSLPNIRGHARAAKRFGASGFIVTDWGDGGHYNLFGGSLFPIAAGAEAAWGDENRPEGELAAAFSEHVAADASGFSGEFATRLGQAPRHRVPALQPFAAQDRVLRDPPGGGATRVPAREALEATRAALRRLAAETEARGLPPGLLRRGVALCAGRFAARGRTRPRDPPLPSVGTERLAGRPPVGRGAGGACRAAGRTRPPVPGTLAARESAGGHRDRAEALPRRGHGAPAGGPRPRSGVVRNA